MALLMDLPREILIKILSYCDFRDFKNIVLTSKALSIISQDEGIWRAKCQRDYGILVNSSSCPNIKLLYSKMLVKYASLIGTYMMKILAIGGLLEVQYKNESIEGNQWRAKDTIDEPLKTNPVFQIFVDPQTGECITKFSCFETKHSSSVLVDKTGSGRHVVNFSNAEAYLRDLYNFDPILDSQMQTYVHASYKSGIGLYPLKIPTEIDIPAEYMQDGQIIQQVLSPGLFKAVYPDHGIELILFKYKNDDKIHGFKVTGDINVYAGEITVKVDLKYPVMPTREQQQSCEDLSEIEPHITENHISQLDEQPFIVPEGCFRNSVPPTSCKARYHGFGHVASTSYINPRYTRIHAMIFSNDCIGVLWMSMEYFTYYKRVNQSFTPHLIKKLGLTF